MLFWGCFPLFKTKPNQNKHLCVSPCNIPLGHILSWKLFFHVTYSIMDVSDSPYCKCCGFWSSIKLLFCAWTSLSSPQEAENLTFSKRALGISSISMIQKDVNFLPLPHSLGIVQKAVTSYRLLNIFVAQWFWRVLLFFPNYFTSKVLLIFIF